jgi:hypothetical protein
MKKIEKLTQEQISIFPAYVDRWTKIGLSTQPIDRARAATAIDKVYKSAGREPPKIKIFLDSPFGGAIGAVYLSAWRDSGDQVGAQVGAQVRAQVGAQVWDQVWAQVRDQVGDQVRDQVRDQVWDQVRDQVWDQVWAQVWAQVRDQVGAQVRDQVGDQVRDQVWAQVRDQVWDQVRDQVWAQVWAQVGAQVRDQVNKAGYGQHDSNWLAFYEFFEKETGLSCCKKLDGLMEVAREAGWFWPFENAVIITSRPTLLKRDEDNRLHCETGPALRYADGWSIYAWHGVRIPSEWIEDKKSLSPETALKWGNLEQRRAACEIVGWDKILSELKAVCVDRNNDPQIGELLEVNLPDSGKEKFLRVVCGTGRTFALPVPPEMKTALEANAWTYGIDAEEYRPEIRT